MSRSQTLPLNLTLIVSLFLVVSSLDAATRLTYQTSRPRITIGSMVQPAAIETSTVWLGEGAARIEKEEGSIYIFDRKTSIAYHLFPKFEVFESTSFMPTGPDTTSVSTEANMLSGLSQLTEKPKAQIESTDDTSTVGGYLCQKFLLSEIKTGMITVYKTSEVWSTTAIEVDFALYRAIMNISELIVSRDLGVLDNLAKIDGVFVRRIGRIEPAPDPDSLMPTVTVGGNDMIELLKVETVIAPDSLFVVPPGYVKSEE